MICIPSPTTICQFVCLAKIFSVIIFVVTGFLPGSSIVSLAARSPSLAFPLFKDEDALVGGYVFEIPSITRDVAVIFPAARRAGKVFVPQFRRFAATCLGCFF